jgi:hypothetical protein
MTAPSGACDRTMTVPHQSPSPCSTAADLGFSGSAVTTSPTHPTRSCLSRRFCCPAHLVAALLAPLAACSSSASTGAPDTKVTPSAAEGPARSRLRGSRPARARVRVRRTVVPRMATGRYGWWPATGLRRGCLQAAERGRAVRHASGSGAAQRCAPTSSPSPSKPHSTSQPSSSGPADDRRDRT